jgi:hypothetical protein
MKEYATYALLFDKNNTSNLNEIRDDKSKRKKVRKAIYISLNT